MTLFNFPYTAFASDCFEDDFGNNITQICFNPNTGLCRINYYGPLLFQNLCASTSGATEHPYLWLSYMIDSLPDGVVYPQTSLIFSNDVCVYYGNSQNVPSLSIVPDQTPFYKSVGYQSYNQSCSPYLDIIENEDGSFSVNSGDSNSQTCPNINLKINGMPAQRIRAKVTCNQ